MTALSQEVELLLFYLISLKINFLQTVTNSDCDLFLNPKEAEKYGIPPFVIPQQIPNGIQKEQACIENKFEKTCQVDFGSPGLVQIKNTARPEEYFEQRFVLSSGFDCKITKMVLVRIASRPILTWIQNITGTFYQGVSTSNYWQVYY